MKRKKDLYNEILNYNYAVKMFNKIKKNAKDKGEIYKFFLNKNQNIKLIIDKLANHEYEFSKYNVFFVKEPKYRLIMCECIEDKIVNHLVSNYILLPSLEHLLIDQNVATRKDKGSKLAFNLIVKYINSLMNKNKDIYCLKIDISKYFYNIDHNILKKMIMNKIKDKDALNIINQILDSTNDEYINDEIKSTIIYEKNKVLNQRISKKEKELKLKELESIPLYKYDKGLPIGNMTSQILAVFYLNDVDHYIKEELKHKYYVRYMDDILIFDVDLDRLKSDFKLITEKILSLKLTINKKSNIVNLKNGVGFVGYNFSIKNGKLLIRYNNKTIKRINRKMKKLEKDDTLFYLKSMSSYKGYFQKVNTKLKNKGVIKINKIYELMKKDYTDSIVFVKQGIFYTTYFNDAKIMKQIFNYKIIDNKLAFPIASKDKVSNKLIRCGFSVVFFNNTSDIVVHETTLENNYNNIINLIEEKENDELKINLLFENISQKIKLDENNYNIINNFINNL